MTKFSMVLIILMVSTVSFCQSYGNIWQMGKNVGIDFNSCSPVLISGNNSGKEGCSTISDSDGQLLFYTNSDTVWNKMHLTMANGSLVPSNGTLSQVIIIPKPGSSSIYYIITTTIQAFGNFSMQYHTVDVSLNGGLGAVINKNNILTPLITTEQVAATYHSDGTDIWLIAHEYGTNKFLSFLVNSTGINTTPVISSVGPAHTPCFSNLNARGEIKFSPDGNKIAFNGNGEGGNDSTSILAVFDFDNTNGIVSNPINLPISRGEYGLSFSPDNTKLYGGTAKGLITVNDYNYLYQFDLTSGVPALINNSKHYIDSIPATANSFGSIKIGPDGKIYIRYGGSNQNYLGVIANPNLSGVSCDYIKEGFYIGNQSYKYGLNNYIEYKTYCSSAELENIKYSDLQLIISPNPFSNQTIVKSNININNGIIKIHDVFGNLVKSYNDLDGQVFLLHCEDLQEGLYFLQIYQGTQLIEQKKVIITR